MLGFQAGLLVGGTAARVVGFTDTQVCAQQSASLTALASVLNAVDCAAYENQMAQIDRDSDQVPVSTMDPMTYRGVTVTYEFGRPWPHLYPHNLLTCFNWSGQVEPGYRFRGVHVYGADGTENGTGSGLDNPNCGPIWTSNLSGWWVKAPLLRYKLLFTDLVSGQVSESPLATGTSATPHPERTWQCLLKVGPGGGIDARSSTFTEQDPTLGAIRCPNPGNTTVTGLQINQIVDNVRTTLLDVSTTPAYQQWIAGHPECANGSCLTDLRKSTVSCFRQSNANACAGWFTSTTRATRYTCYIGTRKVALTDCYVYRSTFDGTAFDDGHGLSDPTTGAVQTEQTTPTKRQRLAKLCRDYLAQTPASGTSTIGAVAGVPNSACDTMPMYFPGLDLGLATTNRANAIANNPIWVRLNYESDLNKKQDVIAQSGPSVRNWYNRTSECKSPAPSNKSCDEFPNYSTLQGVKVANWGATPVQPLVAINYIDKTLNSKEGGYYRAFAVTTCALNSATQANPYASGSAFLEIPGVVDRTTYICKP